MTKSELLGILIDTVCDLEETLDGEHVMISIYPNGVKTIFLSNKEMYFGFFSTYELEKQNNDTYPYRVTTIVDDIEFSTLLTQSDFEQYIQSVVSSTNE